MIPRENWVNAFYKQKMWAHGHKKFYVVRFVGPFKVDVINYIKYDKWLKTTTYPIALLHYNSGCIKRRRYGWSLIRRQSPGRTGRAVQAALVGHWLGQMLSFHWWWFSYGPVSGAGLHEQCQISIRLLWW